MFYDMIFGSFNAVIRRDTVYLYTVLSPDNIRIYFIF